MTFNRVEVGQKLVEVGDKQIAAGRKMEKAGQELRNWSDKLNGDERIARSLRSIERSVVSVVNLLTPISATLHVVVDGLNKIVIPSLRVRTNTIDFPVVGQVSFVSGVTVSSSRPLRTIASQINAIADNIDNIRDGLLTIASSTEEIHNQLPDMRLRIVDASAELETGGSNLVEAGTAMKDAATLLAR